MESFSCIFFNRSMSKHPLSVQSLKAKEIITSWKLFGLVSALLIVSRKWKQLKFHCHINGEMIVCIQVQRNTMKLEHVCVQGGSYHLYQHGYNFKTFPKSNTSKIQRKKHYMILFIRDFLIISNLQKQRLVVTRVGKGRMEDIGQRIKNYIYVKSMSSDQ